jgi:hypothetical protein
VPIEEDTYGPTPIGRAAKAAMLADKQRDIRSKSDKGCSLGQCMCCRSSLAATQDTPSEVEEPATTGAIDFGLRLVICCCGAQGCLAPGRV